MNVGQKIINREILSESEAECVFQDLEFLRLNGHWGKNDPHTKKWHPPSWAETISNKLIVSPAHIIEMLLNTCNQIIRLKYNNS